MSVFELELTESQRMMREACKKFVDDSIIPFISKNWKNEWNMTPEGRLPDFILQNADKLGIENPFISAYCLAIYLSDNIHLVKSVIFL